MLFVLSTGNKVLVNFLVFKECLIDIDLPDVPNFDSLTHLNNFLCIFFSFFCFGWPNFHSCFPLFINTRQIYFQIKCFCRNCVFFFYFCLVNSKCDAYQPIDHSLFCSNTKMFLLFFGLILCLVQNHLSQFISLLLFTFLPLDLGSCKVWVLSLPFPSLLILFFHF